MCQSTPTPRPIPRKRSLVRQQKLVSASHRAFICRYMLEELNGKKEVRGFKDGEAA